MDKTTKDIINLYEQIRNHGIGSYISQYHTTLINRWNEMLINNEYNNDEFKRIRNILYSLFILLLDSINSRNTFIDYCLETIRTHNDNSISSKYDELRELFDNFNNINAMSDIDYGKVVELLTYLYNGLVQYHERGIIHRHIAIIMRKYEIYNKHIMNIINPTTKQELDLDDVVISIYGK